MNYDFPITSLQNAPFKILQLTVLELGVTLLSAYLVYAYL